MLGSQYKKLSLPTNGVIFFVSKYSGVRVALGTPREGVVCRVMSADTLPGFGNPVAASMAFSVLATLVDDDSAEVAAVSAPPFGADGFSSVGGVPAGSARLLPLKDVKNFLAVGFTTGGISTGCEENREGLSTGTEGVSGPVSGVSTLLELAVFGGPGFAYAGRGISCGGETTWESVALGGVCATGA